MEIFVEFFIGAKIGFIFGYQSYAFLMYLKAAVDKREGVGKTLCFAEPVRAVSQISVIFLYVVRPILGAKLFYEDIFYPFIVHFFKRMTGDPIGLYRYFHSFMNCLNHTADHSLTLGDVAYQLGEKSLGGLLGKLKGRHVAYILMNQINSGYNNILIVLLSLERIEIHNVVIPIAEYTSPSSVKMVKEIIGIDQPGYALNVRIL